MNAVINVSGLERNLGRKITLHRQDEARGVVTIYIDAELSRDDCGRFFVAGGVERKIKEGNNTLDKHLVSDIPLDVSHRVYLGNYEVVAIPNSLGVIRKYRAII